MFSESVEEFVLSKFSTGKGKTSKLCWLLGLSGGPFDDSDLGVRLCPKFDKNAMRKLKIKNAKFVKIRKNPKNIEFSNSSLESQIEIPLVAIQVP